MWLLFTLKTNEWSEQSFILLRTLLCPLIGLRLFNCVGPSLSVLLPLRQIWVYCCLDISRAKPKLGPEAGVQILSSNPVPKLTVESKLILFVLLWFCRD